MTPKSIRPIITINSSIYCKQCNQKTGERNMESQSSDERYNVFIENINDGVYELDKHGKFSYFNESMAKILGYSEEEIMGENFDRFLDERYARAARNLFYKIWVARKGFSNIVWYVYY